jgi:uncharacterized membrane protein HdeD (DUF308 family)
MASNSIESAYQRFWWALVLRGVLAVSVGVLILSRPSDSVAVLALIIALWALFSGLVQIVHAFDLRSLYEKWWVLLLSGLVSAGFGAAALYYYPNLSLAFAVVWFGWWLLLTGGLAVYAAFQERKLDLSWGWTMAFGIICIVVGVLAAMNPPTTISAIMGLIAGFAIVSGVALLVAAYKVSSAKQDITSAIRSATKPETRASSV